MWTRHLVAAVLALALAPASLRYGKDSTDVFDMKRVK